VPEAPPPSSPEVAPHSDDAALDTESPPSASGLASIWRLLVGPPLRANQGRREEIGSIAGLPALSLDALTSVAYGPEAILVVLAVAGVGALHYVLPVTLVIIGLLALLVSSYRQVIVGYPGGGGAYAVSRANLGLGTARLAAAALVVDYTLTVAVSIAAGVAALTSAFPVLTPATVPLCLGMLAVITLANLRGLGEAARAFLLPTVLFIVGLLGVIVVGLVHPLAPHLRQPGRSLVPLHPLATVGVLLLLKAFSSGCSALTGVEAIANGTPLFKEPRVIRARRTELLLGVFLGVMLAGLAVLAVRFHVGPRQDDTVLSQIIAYSVGRSWAYYVVSLAITTVLGLAANTSFGGLPVLASLLARDNAVPHLFALRGQRLVYSRGILVLAILAGALLVAVGGNTDALIPLFAIGVFTGFTLAQTGMVVHWRRQRSRGWRRRATLNGVGAVATAVATVIFVATKFLEGAWIVVVAIPLLLFAFARVHAYYERVGRALGIGTLPPPPTPATGPVVVPVTGLSRLTAHALSDALGFGEEVVAVSVVLADDPEPGRALAAAWERWNPGVRLELLPTEYHSVISPILTFVRQLREHHGHVTVLIPVTVPDRWRYRLLHNQLDLSLSTALNREPGVVVARSRLEVAVGPGDPTV